MNRKSLERAQDDEGKTVFVPASLAMVCADCGGYFVAHAGKCPGCGSKHYAPAVPRRRAA